MYVYSFPTSRLNTHGNETAKFTFKTSIFNEGAARENVSGHMGFQTLGPTYLICVSDIVSSKKNQLEFGPRGGSPQIIIFKEITVGKRQGG